MGAKIVKALVIGVIALMTVPLAIQIFYVVRGEKEVKVHEVKELSYADPAIVYSQKCAACHGENADGSEGYPRLNNQSAEQLALKIRGYKNGTYGTGSGAELMKLQVSAFGDNFIDRLATAIAAFKPNEEIHRERRDEKQKREDLKFNAEMNS